jgi:hypothetical protein
MDASFTFFTTAVAQTVVYRKFWNSFICVIMAIFGGIFAFSQWYSLIVAAFGLWFIIDTILVSYRAKIGKYGNNEFETFEAARYVIDQRAGDLGRGRFSHIFAPEKSAVPKTVFNPSGKAVGP